MLDETRPFAVLLRYGSSPSATRFSCRSTRILAAGAEGRKCAAGLASDRHRISHAAWQMRLVTRRDCIACLLPDLTGVGEFWHLSPERVKCRQNLDPLRIDSSVLVNRRAPERSGTFFHLDHCPHLDHVLGEPHLDITSGTQRVNGSKESRGFRWGVGG